MIFDQHTNEDDIRNNKNNMFAGLLFGLFFVFTSTKSLAEEIPIVDGKLWAESSAMGKKAYIIGISNLMSIELLIIKQRLEIPADLYTILQILSWTLFEKLHWNMCLQVKRVQNRTTLTY